MLKKEKRPGICGKREAGGGVLTPDAVCARLVQATAAVGAGVAGGGAQARHRHSTEFKSAFPYAPASTIFLKTQEFRNILICKNNSSLRKNVVFRKKIGQKFCNLEAKKCRSIKNISI
jgi:hypothetical protein